MILGLDISTSITGITVIDSNNNILLCEHLDTRNKNKFPSLLQKASFIRENLREIKDKYEIETIFVEESLQSFRSGFSSAKTLSTLSKINGIISYVCYEVFDIEPEYVAAVSARKLCGIKVPRGTKAKQVVLEFLLDNEPSFAVEYTKQGNPKPGFYDRADSIIVARAGLELCKQKNLKS
jgi:Holliday junction resolvasome RuvABC endonuclease subunit